ncbi:myeloid differentiation primary response protein MyD88-like [Ylistrum balloti]|uniref:myeloid differentiation primary response protein MyD88-like n=1 Tax=Ylistrum balloti TaxID=509963 RepID=UPI0029059176|nr:myeloid differentiation primary response protein MyD88-like [Ylistrum balloti]
MATLPDVVSGKLALRSDGYNLPISILNIASRRKLADMLNQERELDDNIELIPNYTGLAELLNFTFLEIMEFERTDNCTNALLSEWEKRSNPCIGELWRHLEKLQRLDVMEESRKYINGDIESELRRREKPLPSCANIVESEGALPDDQLVLTRADAEYGRPQFYDAFVCWNSESVADADFVKDMARKLEDVGFRLCIPKRDDLPGQAQYHAYASLIKIRCRLMIIVLSIEYHQSVACDFMTKFAHALCPATKEKRLVPILISKMDIPDLLRHVTLCDFTKEDMIDWNWKRLLKAVKEASPDWNENGFERTPRCLNTQIEANNKKKKMNFLKLFTRKPKRDTSDDQ